MFQGVAKTILSLSGEKPGLTRKSLVLLGLMCGSPTILANEVLASLQTEEDFLADIPVVLSATRLAQPKSDVPAAITVIDRSMIEASGIRSIPELVRLVPGFQVGHDYGTLLAPQQTPVTYLGYSDQFSRKMQVLVDGRSIYDPMYGGVRWSELGVLLDDIDRIEVIRGPNAASYGSNAFLGVINIVTRHPASESGATAGFDMSSTGQGLASVRQFGNSEKHNYRLTTFYTRDYGYDDLHDSKSTLSFSYRGEVKLENRDTLDVQLGMLQGVRQLGDDDPSLVAADTYPWHDGNVNNQYQQFKWSRRSSANSEHSLQLYHNYGQFDNLYTAYILGTLTSTDASTKTNRWDIEYQHVLSPGDKWRWVWGAGARLDEAQAIGWFNTNEWQQNYLYRLFANGEWRPSNKWTINLGAMAEQSTVAGDTLSPRLAANYHAGENSTLRAAVSRGYRNPALFEEYANTVVYLNNVNSPPGVPLLYFFSDGSVSAAEVTNYEVGYIRQGKQEKLTLDAKLFLMQLRNTIAYYPDPLAPYVYGNGGEADIQGTEIQLQYRFNQKTSGVLSYAYAQHDGWYVSDNTTIPATTEISNVTTPNHTLSLLLNHKFSEKWSGGVFYHLVSSIDWFNGSNLANGYQVANARLARSFKMNASQGSIEFVAQNIAGDYQDFVTDVTLKRKLYIGVRLPL